MAVKMISVYNPVTDAYCEVPLDKAVKLLANMIKIKSQIDEVQDA
jgi:hypothetical protein